MNGLLEKLKKEAEIRVKLGVLTVKDLSRQAKLAWAILAAILAVVIVALSAAAGSLQKAVSADAIGAVSVDGSFLADSGSVLLFTDGRVNLRYLRKNLRTAGKEAFTVSQVTDQIYSIHFSQLPKPKTRIVLQLRSQKGFGTAKEFPLTVGAASSPENLQMRLVSSQQADALEIDEPILILFSKEVPASQVVTRLTFSAPVQTAVTMVNNVAVITPQAPLEYNTYYGLALSAGIELNGRVMKQSFSTQIMTASPPELHTQDLRAEDFGAPIAEKRKNLTVEALFGGSPATSFDPSEELTLLFSEPVTKSSLENAISFHPAADTRQEVSYDLACQNNVAVIKPTSPLQWNTSYILYIEPGVETSAGSRLNNAYRLEIVTRGSSLTLELTNQESNVADVSKPLTLEFSMTSAVSDHQLIDITLYRMNNYAQYRTMLSVAKIEQTYDLLEIASSTEILRNGLNKVELENPGKGIYLVKASTTDSYTNLPYTFYKCLNVTDLAVYLQATDKETLVWVNNTTTSAAQTGLKAELSDRTTKTVLADGVTGADGSCVLSYREDIPKKVLENGTDGVLSIYGAGGEVIYTDTTSSFFPGRENAAYDNRYYTFFFTDRTLYHPTDTIRFWGYVKPYFLNSRPLPKTIRVYFDKDGLEQSIDAQVSPEGVFSGEIAIEKVKSSQYMLEAYFYEPGLEKEKQLTYLQSTWLEAKNFEKPSFVLTAKSAKPIFTGAEQVEVNANLTFYDGTPIPNYPLELQVMNMGEGNVQEVRKAFTDSSGRARFLFSPDSGVGKKLQNGPSECYYTVVLAQDGGTVYQQGTYFYQPAGIVANVEASVSGEESLRIEISTNTVSADGKTTEQLSAFLSEERDRYYDNAYTATRLKKIYQTLADKPVDVGVQGTVLVSYTDQRGEGRTQTFPLGAVTKGGKLQEAFLLETPYDPEKNVHTEVMLSCVDDNLNLISSEWLANTKDVYPPSYPESRLEEPEVKGYTLAVKKNQEDAFLPITRNYMGQGDLLADMGDRLTFQLCKDGVPVSGTGKLFYQLVQDRTISRRFTAGSSFSLTETLNYAQSVQLIAAYFDGAGVYPVQDMAIRLNLESVGAEIAFTQDRPSYRPGETANLQLHVSNRSGAPLMSNLCVSIVDESIFALSEQYLDVTEALYSQVAFQSIYIQKYATGIGDYRPTYTGGDMGKGGGGIEAYDVIRQDFKDTAFFYPVKTDAQGNAQVSFKLPDNLTSWRVTTVAIGGSLYGGSAKQNVITTMPFFSKPVITSKYLAGDEVVMLTQGHGTLLKEDSQISYQIRLQGDGVDETINAAGGAFEPVRVSLGKLAAGEYTLSSTAQFSDYRDTVKLPLIVTPNNLEMVVNQKIDPTRLEELGVMRYPVTLTFYDKEHQAFYKSLGPLLTHFCSRTDQRLSRYTAKKALQKGYGQGAMPYYIAETGSYIGDLQRPDGGIGWYSDDNSSDPMLTAKVLMAVGNQFNTRRMVAYFEGLLENGSLDGTTKAAVYAGLSVLNPDTTKEINRILNSASVPLQEELYYLAGLAFGGDEETALALYKRDVTPYVRTAGDGQYISYSNQDGPNEALTATAWIVASRLGLADADAFALYFAADKWGIGHIFESMIYVDQYRKSSKVMLPVKYTQNGVPKIISLGATGQASLLCDKSTFEGMRFSQASDRVEVLAYYIGEPTDAAMDTSKNLSIDKKIEKLADGSYLNTISVRFQDGAPMGSYDISDWIPSNMRFFGMKEWGGASYTQELQNMYFTIYRQTVVDNAYTISYITRKTFDAQVLQDRTYMIHAESGQYNFSERKELQV